ncbi:MAG: (2Fe-2S)-binding protein [Bacteriovoracaceae bacterium]|jgi:bacterioferritin-associated ferredoxin|nr:(2Fe-2S)-binding protein [Bacteriovoracaceae bacterium]
MENKNQQYSYFGVMDDAHVSYTSEYLSLYLKIDANECIYSFKYESKNPAICNFFEYNQNFFIDAKIDNTFFSKAFHKVNNVTDQIVLFHFKSCIDSFLGKPSGLSPYIEGQIICFCAKVTSASLIDHYKKSYGDLKKVYLATNASSFCGQCSCRVERILKDEVAKGEFFLGEDKGTWTKKIEDLISDFAMFSPAGYEQLNFSISSLKTNIVKLKCSRPSDSNLKRREIQKTLENFFRSETNRDIKVSVVI